MSPQKRNSLSPTTPQPTSDLKHRVISCLNRLSDRDTLSLATTELESIAKNLTHDTFTSFLNCIHNTDSSSKSPVRKQCVTLLTLLSNSHGNNLSTHLPKMVSTVTRRLHDSDSAVRTACVEATAAMSSQITNPPFSNISKPLIDVLTVEQDLNAQIGAAMCLSAAIEVAPEPNVEMLRKLLPKLGKLVRSEGFKGKGVALSVIGSIVGVGAARSKVVLGWLVPMLVEALSFDDWSGRKAAAEALGKVAVVEVELGKEYKALCLGALETRRFDKVKVVRETMNRTMELWKEVPGIAEETPVRSLSRSSSLGNTGGACYSSASEGCNDVGSKTYLRRKSLPAYRSPPLEASLTSTAKKQSPSRVETECKKSPSWKVEVAAPQEMADERLNCGYLKQEEDERNKDTGPASKRVLFSSIRDKHKVGGLRSGSRVFPYNDDENCLNKDTEVSHPIEEFYENQNDAEDLSMIRKQLLEIENQQSNMLELIQRFIGSSQNGINSLESRVNGLEMVLDEISYDLGVSSGRIPNMDPSGNTCCKLPVTEFLSSKFWRRTEDRQYSASRYPSSRNIRSVDAAQTFYSKDTRVETHNLDSRGVEHQVKEEFSVNPTSQGQHNC